MSTIRYNKIIPKYRKLLIGGLVFVLSVSAFLAIQGTIQLENKSFTCTERSVPKSFISTTCNCSKQVPVGRRKQSKLSFKWCSDEASVRGSNQKVVTYALFGNPQGDAGVFRRYYSMMRNISLTIKKEYPGWTMRIYHNIVADDEENEAYNQLCKVFCRHSNVDLCSVPDIVNRIGNETTPIDPQLIRGLNPKMYRYLVMMDPDVDVFVSRDVDSLIWRREVDAVKEWLSSNYTFHLMRDHTAQDAIISAGMFGVKVHQRRDLIEGIVRALIVSGQNQGVLHDQASLDDILWPVAKYDVMAHDSYHCQNERLKRTSPIPVFPFPTKRDGSYYVGGVGHQLVPVGCPLACRPPNHPDWEMC